MFLLYAFFTLFAKMLCPFGYQKHFLTFVYFPSFFCEALKMTSRPLKRPGRLSKRKCRKRRLSISSLIFCLVVLFSIVYTVYQFVSSNKSKSNLLSKYYKISVFPYFVLNSYYSVSYRIIICLVTFYLVISIHKLETCLQVWNALVTVST